MALTFKFKNAEIKVGDSVKVNYKIREKDKERIQTFDGIILAIKGRGTNQTFIVQKHASDKVDVERIFPTNSPWIDSIRKMRSAKRPIRRAKLYFLRDSKARTL